MPTTAAAAATYAPCLRTGRGVHVDIGHDSPTLENVRHGGGEIFQEWAGTTDVPTLGPARTGQAAARPVRAGSRSPPDDGPRRVTVSGEHCVLPSLAWYSRATGPRSSARAGTPPRGAGRRRSGSAARPG